MKNLLSIFFLCAFVSAKAQGVEFIQNDWNRAIKEAKEQNKYLFVDAYTDWCYWCKVMDKKTFPDAAVAKLMKEKFVSLKLEMEHDYGVNVAMKYRVSGFPSFLILTPDGQLVRKLVGYIEAKQFVEELEKSLDPKVFPALQGISKDVDLAFPDFYKNMFTLEGKKIRPNADDINNYLADQKDLFSEVNYSVMIRFASLIKPTFSDYLLSNKEKYESLYGKDEMNDAVEGIVNGMMRNSIKNNSENELEQAINFAYKNQLGFTETTRTLYRINFYRGTENWPAMSKQVDRYIADNGYTSSYINDWSWTVYEKCNDPEIVNKAIEWMKPVIDKQPDYATTDTYAALLYKAGKKADAKTYALKAIELGKAAGEKTTETEALLKKITGKK